MGRSGYLWSMTTFNLRTARLRPGEAWRGDVPVRLEPLELGGQRYVPVPEEPEASLAITRRHLRPPFRARLRGLARRAAAFAASRTRASNWPSAGASITRPEATGRRRRPPRTSRTTGSICRLGRGMRLLSSYRRRSFAARTVRASVPDAARTSMSGRARARRRSPTQGSRSSPSSAIAWPARRSPAATLRRFSWPFRSERHRSRGATSVAPT